MIKNKDFEFKASKYDSERKCCADIKTRHDVKESGVSGRADRGFTLLVQLSCVSRHYEDRRRENRGAYITACLTAQELLKRQA